MNATSGVGRITGSAVYDETGRTLGSIGDLTIEKAEGTIRAVTVLFGGVLGIAATRRELPWHSLSYEPTLDGYVVKAAWLQDEESQAALEMAPVAPA